MQAHVYPWKLGAAGYVTGTLLLWPIPLLNILHVESGAVVATLAFWLNGWAGWKAPDAPLGPACRTAVGLLALPISLLTISLFWAPNAGYVEGAMYFLLCVVPSALLGLALSVWTRTVFSSRPGTKFVALGLALIVVPPLTELALFPQFYHYNPVFGGVMGPVYDEELTLRTGFLVARGMVLVWAAVLFLWARGYKRRAGWGLAVLGFLYALAPWLGLVTPAWKIERALGGRVDTPWISLVYPKDALTRAEAEWLAARHDAVYARLAAEMGVQPRSRVYSYLYEDAESRAHLTGARYTAVAPIWLRRPQTHLLLDQFDALYGHELAHVFSREFGLPLVPVSVHVGLVEGLAVAFEGPRGGPFLHEQVAAAATIERRTKALARDVAASLGAFGFWTGRGAVSYTTMGSFVQFLREQYGMEALRAVYAKGNFEEVYGKPVEVLAQAWADSLSRLTVVSRSAGPVAQARFSVPSLFEKPSPHYVPRPVRWTRLAEQAVLEGDTLLASRLIAQAVQREPFYVPARDLEARLWLAAGRADTVVARYPEQDTLFLASRVLQLRVADAYGTLGERDRALVLLRSVRRSLPGHAHGSLLPVLLREDAYARPEWLPSLYQPPGEMPPEAPPAIRALHALRTRDAQQRWEQMRSLRPLWPRPFGRRGHAVWALYRAEAARAACDAKAFVGESRDAWEKLFVLGDLPLAAYAEALHREALFLRERFGEVSHFCGATSPSD